MPTFPATMFIAWSPMRVRYAIVLVFVVGKKCHPPLGMLNNQRTWHSDDGAIAGDRTTLWRSSKTRRGRRSLPKFDGDRTNKT
jgi:hypothetical protein